jgi:hypothetical protein
MQKNVIDAINSASGPLSGTTGRKEYVQIARQKGLIVLRPIPVVM